MILPFFLEAFDAVIYHRQVGELLLNEDMYFLKRLIGK